MPSFKTANREYDGIKFMSYGEVEMYKLLKDSELNFEYQPAKIEIIPKFTAASGKKYPAMNYEADFYVPCNGTKGILIEVKGNNDKVFTPRKGGGLGIKDNSELYRLRHKHIDFHTSKKGYIFLVVRDAGLKTPEFAGLFWDKDFSQMKKFKTQKNKPLCAEVPRIMQRVKDILKIMQRVKDRLKEKND